MKHLVRWVAVLMLAFAFFAAIGGSSAHAASTNQTPPKNVISCGAGVVYVLILAEGGNFFYCGFGYTGLNITHVNEIDDDISSQIWVRWYATGQVPYGQYCWVNGHESANFADAGYNDALVTQLDIGGGTQGNQCPV